ncbi:MAG TPA: hypothetical protein ENN03_05375 [bacterium]|nr:hypothetical protein [bacterium]
MKRSIVLFALIGLISGCAKIESLRYGEMRHRVVVESSTHAAFPDIVRLKTGEWMVVYRQGSGHVSPDGVIMRTVSTDQGKTWSEPDTIVNSVWDCRDPSVIQLEDGLILISFFQSRYDEPGKAPAAVSCFVVRSFDNGKSFTAPRRITMPGVEWSATSAKILTYSDGTLLMPVYGGNAGEKSRAMAVISRDGGDTWTEIVTVARDPGQRIDFQEPCFVLSPSGSIVCLMRTAGADDYLYRVQSSDGGRSWNAPASTSIQGQAPGCLVTPDGIMVCAYRDFWPRGVSYSISYNDGITWEAETQIWSAAGDCAYPSLIGDTGDRVHAVYYEETVTLTDQKSYIRSTAFVVGRPHAPFGVHASFFAGTGVQIRWNHVEGAVYYLVYRGMEPDFNPQGGYPRTGNAIASPTESRFTDRSVQGGATYYYRITAVATRGAPMENRGGESPASDAVEVIVQ